MSTVKSYIEPLSSCWTCHEFGDESKAGNKIRESTANNKLFSQQRNISHKGEHKEVSLKHPSLGGLRHLFVSSALAHNWTPVEVAPRPPECGEGLGDQLPEPKNVEQRGNHTCQTYHSLHRPQIPTGKPLCLTN